MAISNCRQVRRRAGSSLSIGLLDFEPKLGERRILFAWPLLWLGYAHVVPCELERDVRRHEVMRPGRGVVSRDKRYPSLHYRLPVGADDLQPCALRAFLGIPAVGAHVYRQKTIQHGRSAQLKHGPARARDLGVLHPFGDAYEQVDSRAEKRVFHSSPVYPI